MTSFFAWNTRGFNNKRKQDLVNSWIREVSPEFGCLLETRVKSDKYLGIVQRTFPGWNIITNYNNHRLGRIWFLWNPQHCVTALYIGPQIITVLVKLENEEEFIVSAIYASNFHQDRLLLWSEIKHNHDLFVDQSTPWILLGDFNQILHPSEHSSNYHGYWDHHGIREFQNLVTECDLTDLHSIGPKYTWWNRQGADPIGKKLDRVLINEAWQMRFPRSYSVYEANGISDHARGSVFTSPPNPHPRYHFQFFNFLTEDPCFQDIVASSWNQSEPIYCSRMAIWRLHKKLKALKPCLRELNKRKYGGISNRAKEALTRLCSAQDEALQCPCQASFDAASEALDTWTHFADVEEKFYKQKSRIRWLQNGDRNTAFFHRSLLTRNSKNSIKRLRTGEGILVTSHADIKKEAVSYYTSLFDPPHAPSSPIIPQHLLQLIPFRCDVAANAKLTAPISPEEIKATLFSLPHNKSPGPDGYTVEFFTACWSIVGKDFTSAILSYFCYGFLPQGVNATKLVLIPKRANAECMKDFRPISCCNIIYKVISKILANRLMHILPDAIMQNQCAFVKGRLLLENVLLATELVKNYHKKNISARCVMKLDITKAFDTIRWDFIAATLQAMGISDTFINWIMGCITSASFSIALNGNLEGFFSSSRGIRQGCSLSPYIFVIAMNVLSLSLNVAAESRRIGYHPYCKELKLTHLCFADDLMVFMNGQADSVENTIRVLEEFHLMSGLGINLAKSSIAVGGNTDDSLALRLRALGIPIQDLPFRYLGLPLTTKHMTTGDFSPLTDRIKNRLLAWASKTLSYAGRLQLISAVIKSITDFWCSAFTLPRKCFRIIDSLCAAFLWSGSPLITSKAKIAWSEVCVPKSEGGLGLRRLRDSAQVFSLSLIWRLLTNAGSLWVAWVKRYLLRQTNFWEVKLTNRGSWNWRKLLALRPLAQKFIRHDLGSGNLFLFWLDDWRNKGRLIDVLGNDGIRKMGIRRLALVSDVVINGTWSFNRSRHPSIQAIIQDICAIPTPSPSSPPDSLLWRHDQQSFKNQFSSKKTWSQLYIAKPKVQWYRAVWFAHNSPRQAFITWLTIHNRLPTGDRACRWGHDQDCKLCGERNETRSHLFFACPFSFTIWTSIIGKLLRRTDPDWITTLNVIAGKRYNKIDSYLIRLVFQACIYHIWRERNNRRHSTNRAPTTLLATNIRREIRNRLLALKGDSSEATRNRWAEITNL